MSRRKCCREDSRFEAPQPGEASCIDTITACWCHGEHPLCVRFGENWICQLAVGHQGPHWSAWSSSLYESHGQVMWEEDDEEARRVDA